MRQSWILIVVALAGCPRRSLDVAAVSGSARPVSREVLRAVEALELGPSFARHPDADLCLVLTGTGRWHAGDLHDYKDPDHPNFSVRFTGGEGVFANAFALTASPSQLVEPGEPSEVARAAAEAASRYVRDATFTRVGPVAHPHLPGWAGWQMVGEMGLGLRIQVSGPDDANGEPVTVSPTLPTAVVVFSDGRYLLKYRVSGFDEDQDPSELFADLFARSAVPCAAVRGAARVRDMRPKKR